MTINKKCICLYLIGLGAILFLLISCDPNWNSWHVNKVDIRYSGLGNVSGKVKKIEKKGNYDYLLLEKSLGGIPSNSLGVPPGTSLSPRSDTSLNTYSIKLSPSLQDAPISLIKVGDNIEVRSRRTIGNSSTTLVVYREGVKKVVIATGHTFSIIDLSDKSKKLIYQIKIGKAVKKISGGEQPSRIEVSLRLEKLEKSENNSKDIVLAPHKIVQLGSGWNFYLVQAKQDNPDFKFNSHIARERAPLDYDYIGFRE